MFEPRRLRVHYQVERKTGESFQFRRNDQESGESFHFSLNLDESGLMESLPEHGPEWASASTERCSGCTSTGRYCRAALAIAPVVDAFLGLNSLESVRTRVTVANRVTETIAPVSQVISSLMGLCMAASGCPRTAPFRAMAVYHQPFATLEETVIRAAGFALLGRWAHGKPFDDEDPFAELLDSWGDLEEVNMRIVRRLQAYCATDAALNGLVNLDMFAKGGSLGLRSALEALKPALLDHPETVGELF